MVTEQEDTHACLLIELINKYAALASVSDALLLQKLVICYHQDAKGAAPLIVYGLLQLPVCY